MSKTFQQSSVQLKRVAVSIQERSYIVGDVIGVNGYRVNRTLLAQRFAEGGYEAHETAHFLIFTRVESPSLIVVHWFAPEELNDDIGQYFIQELKPLGIITNSQQFGDVFGSIVSSLFPHDIERAWYLSTTNTLQKYQDLLNAHDAPASDLPINTFAKIYKRVCELCVGKTVLDAGCSSGYFPLLFAERISSTTFVLGIDIRSSPFHVARTIAKERHLTNVQFAQMDILEDISTLGLFDTVTALHVLEHFVQVNMYRVLVNLWGVTSKRLIIAVPYELLDEPEKAYGHEQLFTRAKLEEVRQWCLQKLVGAGRVWCEECEGGLVVIERCSPHKTVSAGCDN